MPTAIDNIPRNQIQMLESGLKSLKQSKLITSRELRDMYSAIDNHHRDVQLAHLTGKPKDLLEQAKQDTKFYYILTKMLKEVMIGTHREQQDSLREVYSWYQSNKHILHSAPRFGKQKENKAPKSAKGRVKSAASRPRSGGTDVSSGLSRVRPGSSGLAKLGHIQRQANEALAMDMGYETDLHELEKLHTLQEQRRNGGDSFMSGDMSAPAQSSLSATMSNLEGASSPDLTSSATKRISEPYQHLLPKRTPQPLSHMYNPHAREYDGVNEGEVIPIDGGRVHVKMQNVGRGGGEPKTANMRKWEQFQQQFTYGQDILSKLSHCGRTGVAGGVRYIAHEGGLAAEYMTPIVVSSYAAAQTKEQPKKEPVKNILVEKSLEEFYDISENYYPAHLPKYPSFSRVKSAASTKSSQPLKPIEKIADGNLSSSQQSLVPSPKEKVKTKQLEAEENTEIPPPPQPSSSPVSVKTSTVTFEEPSQEAMVAQPSPPPSTKDALWDMHGEEQKKQVKLDTVVHMIDSVTDEMTHYKERLLPAPQPGFRLPIQEVDPNERPQTAPITGTVARPSSPLCEDDRAETSSTGFPPRISSAGPEFYSKLPSPPNSQYGGGGNRPRRPDSRASTVNETIYEGRGKIVPDVSRYNASDEVYIIHEETLRLPTLDGVGDPEKTKHVRWQETPYGGRTYYRKRPGSSLRSAGKARVPAGGRPKTAPQTPRERWATQNPSDDNKKPAVAASHTTTEVEEEVMDHLFEVRHLGGKYGRQRRRFFFDYRPDSRDRPYSSMTASTPAMEYLSFIAPKPVSRASSAVQRSRMGSAMDGTYQSGIMASSDGDEEEDQEDDDSMDSMGNDLDLPDVDDLDDDLGDDFQYEGDLVPEGEFPEDDQFEQTEHPQHTHITNNFNQGEVLDPLDVKESHQDFTTDEDLLDQFSDRQSEEGKQEEDESEGDFDSVNIQSSTQDSDSRIDIEQQVADSRRLIDEINDLVQPEGNSREIRPFSSHSRVTFQEDKLEEIVNENSRPATDKADSEIEGGRKVLKPKSILVPRHIQAPPNVGLTIVQFNRGDPAPESNKVQSAPTPTARGDSNQVLTQSEHWSFTPGEIDLQLEGNVSIASPRSAGIKPRQFTHSFPKTTPHPPAEQDLGLSVQGFSGGHKQRVRSAGSVPMRAKSVNHQRVLQRQREMLKNAPAVARSTAPSIPSSHHPYGARGNANAPFMPELEKQARRDHSPRNFMQKVGGLRNKTDLMWVTSNPERSDDGLLTTTLRVARIQPSGRNDNSSPEERREGYPGTPVSYFDEDKASEKSELKNEPGETESQGSSERSPRDVITVGNGGKATRVYLYHGRPIPNYGEAKTPEQYEEAMRIQQEAKAAVDIQRIFRGFLVRQNYKYLHPDEIKKKEDERKAATEIQKAFRGHLVRKKKIYSKSNTRPETIEWAKNFKEEQKDRQRLREFKAFKVAEQNAKNKATTDAKISVIGPHVDVYAPFHPKKTGPDQAVLNLAATCIQRHMKGWLIRKKFEKIKRKSKQHASSWSRFTAQYRELLRRVQSRHGIERPKVPFDFDAINEFMDVKKMYEAKFTKIANGPYFDGFESGFESHAYAGELEFDDLMDYFHECDLYPAQLDVDHAMDLVFRGQETTKKRGLQRHQVMELTYQLYPPNGTGITNSRRSTWMNPMVDGEEAIRLMGTEGVESTDFETVWKLVSSSRKEQQETKDLAEKDKKDAEHNLIMDEKRKREIELRNELRKMGHAGYRGKDYAKKKTLLETVEDEENGSANNNKKDKKVHFSKEVSASNEEETKTENTKHTEDKNKQKNENTDTQT